MRLVCRAESNKRRIGKISRFRSKICNFGQLAHTEYIRMKNPGFVLILIFLIGVINSTLSHKKISKDHEPCTFYLQMHLEHLQKYQMF